MLQRIQTIYLFLAVLAFGSLFYLPFAQTETAYENFLADKIYNIMDSSLLIIVVIIGIVITLISIFLFRNRPLQIRLGWIAVIIGVLIPILAGLEFYRNMGEIEKIDYNLGLGLFIPVIIVVVLVFAIRNIKKDEELVRSSDRLR